MKYTFETLKCEYLQLASAFNEASNQYDDGKITASQYGEAVLAYDEFPHYLDSVESNVLSQFMDWQRLQRLKSRQNA